MAQMWDPTIDLEMTTAVGPQAQVAAGTTATQAQGAPPFPATEAPQAPPAAPAAPRPDIDEPPRTSVLAILGKIIRRLIPIGVIALAIGAYYAQRKQDMTRPYEWSGSVEARTISIGSRTGGRIKEVKVHEGDHVKEGDVLIELEPGDLQAQKLIAEAQLAQAKAALEKLQKGSRGGEISAARAHAVGASVQVSKARQDLDRVRKLYASNAISRAELDHAEAAFAEANAGASEANAQASLVVQGSRSEDIKAAASSVDAMAGRLAQIGVLIDELEIRAPRTARVESLDLRPGDILAPNAPAATLLEDGQLYVRVYVPETRLASLKVGTEVPVKVDQFPNRTFTGRVEHLNSVGEYTPRNLQTADERADYVFAARIGLLDPQDLRAGMVAFILVPK